MSNFIVPEFSCAGPPEDPEHGDTLAFTGLANAKGEIAIDWLTDVPRNVFSRRRISA